MNLDKYSLGFLIKWCTVEKHERMIMVVLTYSQEKSLEHFLMHDGTKYYCQFEINNYPSGPFFVRRQERNQYIKKYMLNIRIYIYMCVCLCMFVCVVKEIIWFNPLFNKKINIVLFCIFFF